MPDELFPLPKLAEPAPVDLDAIAAGIDAHASANPYAFNEKRSQRIVALRGEDLGGEQTGNRLPITETAIDLGQIVTASEQVVPDHIRELSARLHQRADRPPSVQDQMDVIRRNRP